MEQCNIFIAPRKFEGVGVSFLEAMARGIVVIAPDNPTMNEYIEHNKNGYLYDWKDPKAISLENLPQLRGSLRVQALEKYQLWKKSKSKLLKELSCPVRKQNPFLTFFYSKIYFNLDIILVKLLMIIKQLKKKIKIW